MGSLCKEEGAGDRNPAAAAGELSGPGAGAWPEREAWFKSGGVGQPRGGA